MTLELTGAGELTSSFVSNLAGHMRECQRVRGTEPGTVTALALFIKSYVGICFAVSFRKLSLLTYANMRFSRDWGNSYGVHLLRSSY